MPANDWIGREATIELEVSARESADAYGNIGLDVLATPALVALFERASMAAIRDLLGPNEISVGAEVEIRHQAPTPVGSTVRVNARVVEADGRSVWFEVSAADATEPIGFGRHRRFVIEAAPFWERLAAKVAAR